MVTITNGIKTFRVSAGAVKPYENMGFHVATDAELEKIGQPEFPAWEDQAGESVKVRDESVGALPDVEEEVEDDGMSAKERAYVEELLEKPLSQWSSEEVKEFVKIKGIDTSGAQKVSQVRGIIKSYLEEQNKNA